MKEWSTRNISVSKIVVLVIVTGLLLAGCSKQSDQAVRQPPVAIRPGDTCAVCGMYITHYPGPRGEAYIQGQKVPLKFGSTRDFFAYVLQPQNKPILETLYVQDMAATSWRHPEGHWIDARTAWYVPESALPGAMGPTLASFLHRKDAVAFAHRYGGKVIRFDDVTDRLITDLSMQKMPMEKGRPETHQENPDRRRTYERAPRSSFGKTLISHSPGLLSIVHLRLDLGQTVHLMHLATMHGVEPKSC